MPSGSSQVIGGSAGIIPIVILLNSPDAQQMALMKIVDQNPDPAHAGP